MPEPEPPSGKRLDPWLANELRRALDARDTHAVFVLLGDYLELQGLKMPSDRLADWRARDLLEGDG